MSEIEALEVLHERWPEFVQDKIGDTRGLVDEVIYILGDLVMACESDIEDFNKKLNVDLETCGREQAGMAFYQVLVEEASNSSDPDTIHYLSSFEFILTQRLAGASFEDIAASEELFESAKVAFEHISANSMNTEIWYSDGISATPANPSGAGAWPNIWACVGDRNWEWVLNYGSTNGRFCGSGEDHIWHYEGWDALGRKSNEFNEPWIAFNCTKFNGCGLDDVYIADLLFEDPNIKKQLDPHRSGRRFDVVDFGLCRRAISGERLCVLNGHIILFKGGYQQGQTRQRLTLN